MAKLYSKHELLMDGQLQYILAYILCQNLFDQWFMHSSIIVIFFTSNWEFFIFCVFLTPKILPEIWSYFYNLYGCIIK